MPPASGRCSTTSRPTRRNSPTAARIPHAPTSSRGCRRRCSTGRCIPRGTSPPAREKIAAYADNQLQVKGGILIGIWDEAELAAIRKKIGIQPA